MPHKKGKALANAVYLGMADCAQLLSLSNIEFGPIKSHVTRAIFSRVRQSTARRVVNTVMQMYNF